MSGPMVGRLVAGVALAHRRRRPLARNASRNVVGDPLLHQDPDGGQADLPRVVELLDGEVDGEVEVGVVEHQQRRLAAELEADRGDVLGRRRADPLGRRHADPVKLIRRTPRVRHEGRARLGAHALDDVEHAGGQARLGRDVGEQGRRQRRPLRRLGHDGVAGGERRGDAPGREHEGRVPRGDDRGDAGRVPGDVVAVAAGLEVVVVQPRGGGRRRSGSSCATRGITPRRCERSREPLSRVSTWASSSMRFSTPSAMRCRIARSLLRRGARPGAEGLARGGDGGVDLRRRRRGRPRAMAGAVDGRHVGERRGARDPPAADPVPGVDLDAGHDRRLAHVGPHGAAPGQKSFGPKRTESPMASQGHRGQSGTASTRTASVRSARATVATSAGVSRP